MGRGRFPFEDGDAVGVFQQGEESFAWRNRGDGDLGAFGQDEERMERAGVEVGAVFGREESVFVRIGVEGTEGGELLTGDLGGVGAEFNDGETGMDGDGSGLRIGFEKEQVVGEEAPAGGGELGDERRFSGAAGTEKSDRFAVAAHRAAVEAESSALVHERGETGENQAAPFGVVSDRAEEDFASVGDGGFSETGVGDSYIGRARPIPFDIRWGFAGG